MILSTTIAAADMFSDSFSCKMKTLEEWSYCLCFLLVFFLIRAFIQPDRSGRRAVATSSIIGCSTSPSCSVTESSSGNDSSSESIKSGYRTGEVTVTTSSAKCTRRLSSTRLWNRNRMNEGTEDNKNVKVFLNVIISMYSVGSVMMLCFLKLQLLVHLKKQTRFTATKYY